MQVIGKAKDSYIVHLSEDELANMCGYRSKYDSEFNGYLQKLGCYDNGVKVGSTIPIGDWWRMLENMRSNARELAKLGDTLRGFSDIVCGVWPLVQQKIEEKKS